MKPVHSAEEGQSDTPVAGEDFSLVLGGPLYRLLFKAQLMRPPFALLYRRMLVLPALAWLPLLLLTLWEGSAYRGVSVPFLLDVEPYARFLLAMPILLFAEIGVHRKLREIILELREREIVPAASMPKFDEAIEATTRLRTSLLAEILLLVIVFLAGPWLWHHGLALQTDTWYAADNAGRIELSWAGWWFNYVSAPMFQFLLLRWYFRLGLWWRFLWRISRLPLELNARHPDRSGGLGVLGDSISAFMPVLFAQSVLVSSIIASRVLSGANSAVEFTSYVGVFLILMAAEVLVPLTFFTPKLEAARLDALHSYDRLAIRYVREFERKWLSDTAPKGEALLGSPDIQSLADLGAGSETVRGTWALPFDWRELIFLILATVTPFFPLILTVIPFSQLVRGILGMLL